MEQILFDPEFVDEIDDEQLEFVLLHEILHCALGHPLRAGTMNFDLFQIACDIVVNSVALEELHLHTILFENQPVMCIAPDGLLDASIPRKKCINSCSISFQRISIRKVLRTAV